MDEFLPIHKVPINVGSSKSYEVFDGFSVWFSYGFILPLDPTTPPPRVPFSGSFTTPQI